MKRLYLLLAAQATALAVLLTVPGCDPSPEQADAAISHSISESGKSVSTLRSLAVSLPDGDPNKAALLAFANDIESSAKRLSERTAADKNTDSQFDSSTGWIRDVGKAVPVPGVDSVIAGSLAIWGGLAARKRAGERDKARQDLDARNEQAKALVNSIEAAKSNPSFASALPVVSAILDSVQANVPGTKELVDSAQKERESVLKSVGAIT